MRTKISTSLFFLLLLSAFLPAAAVQPMWKVTGNGLQQPSYLFGTSALQSVGLYKESPKLQDAFARAGTLIVESNSTPTEFVSKIRTYGLMKDQKLKQLLPDDVYKKVDKEVQGAITIGLFFLPGSIKPAAVSMIICSAWLKQEMGHPNEEFLNKYLITQCKRRKIPVVSLESAEEQMNMMMNHHSPQYQADLLKQLIARKEEMLRTYKQGEIYYRQGEYEKVAQLGLSHPLPYAKDAKGLEEMITGRNKEWLSKIITQIRAKSCLILLNPAQLVFDGGMIEMLRKAGFTVTKE